MRKLFGLEYEFRAGIDRKIFFWLPTLQVYTEKHKCDDPFCVLNYKTILYIGCAVGNFTCGIGIYNDGWIK